MFVNIQHCRIRTIATMTTTARHQVEDLRRALHTYYDIYAQVTPTRVTLLVEGAHDYPATQRAEAIADTLTLRGLTAHAHEDRVTLPLHTWEY
ncbi:hypothetical protein [Nocardiopsis sp. NPDC006938]|uniref:hypothetical protein n=1 Tax=Nocardiopsis sp. NPDC006938 TaxID=3364337 RepID=UPI0036B764C4